ncbi:transcriptional regulator, AsnC family protein [Polaribacter irgensii 23-P]|jgi:DNA-binding Lrp family transcriptional regulator|uniref:Transcriptional regulator, AsnC family protein n=1 Tax=Polaribacter irgensii 23-P TaxID=313594 RepID=A4C0I8_9FLAO|nr:Lrp/AsnC family transcriptional regulator [Polaribacter irgensii]EAR12931.1 transcriptional regulator, AsnC family protein [Polaribacter irgensii 23-P]
MENIRKYNQNNELDKTDEQIIRLLQKNARLSNKQIAAAVGIAESTCSERMRKLNKKKIFFGFHAFVDSSKLGTNIEAMVSIKLTKNTKEKVEDFKNSMLLLPEVINTYHLAGHSDFLLYVAVRDKNHLRDLLMDHVTKDYVKSLETSLIYDFTQNPLFPIYLNHE